MLASNIVLISFCIIGLSAQSHGIQVGLNSTCTFGPGLSYRCNMSPMLAISARIDRVSAIEDRTITLMFVVPEERGYPCLGYLSSTFDGRWGQTCRDGKSLRGFNYTSYGNGTYRLIFTEKDLFSRNQTYWLFNISGRRCDHEICTLRLNASNLNDCCSSTSSLPFEISSTVSPPNDSTKLESPSENESVSPTVLSVIIFIVVLVVLAFLIVFIHKFNQKRQVQKPKVYEWDISQPSLSLYSWRF